MLSFPTQFRQWIAPLIIACLSLIGYWFEPASSEQLAYQRTAIDMQEYWRLITGHLLHTNFAHLVLNLLGFLLLWALHGEYYTPKRLILFMLLSSMMTSAGIYLFSSSIIWYVGLSGILHGLFVWGACFDIVRKESTGWLLLIGVAIKIGYEQFDGDTQSIADLIGASVAVDAHLYGAISGLLIGAASIFATKFRTTRATA